MCKCASPQDFWKAPPQGFGPMVVKTEPRFFGGRGSMGRTLELVCVGGLADGKSWWGPIEKKGATSLEPLRE